MTLPTPLSAIQQRLAAASTPAEANDVAALAQAGMAWAKERGDYEAYLAAWRAYVDARRKTTELLLPLIQQGRPSKRNTRVTFLGDISISRAEWLRRRRELDIPGDMLEDYLDECLENGWMPSLAGLMRHNANRNGETPTDREYVRALFAARIRSVMALPPLPEWDADKRARFAAAQEALGEFVP